MIAGAGVRQWVVVALRGFALLTLTVLLSGCVSWLAPLVPERLSLDQPLRLFDQRMRLFEQRLERLDDLQRWRVSGRLGVVTEEERLGLSLNWRQLAPGLWRINLSGPLATGSVRLDGGRDGVLMRTSRGDEYRSTDARALLLRETGVDLPAEALTHWLQGRPVGSAAAADVLELDQAGRLERLEQFGWSLSYSDYRPAQGLDLDVPYRVEALGEGVRIRVIVDQWSVSDLAADAEAGTQ